MKTIFSLCTTMITLILSCRVTVQENIDMIKLQREVKEKSTKLYTLEEKYRALEQVGYMKSNETNYNLIFSGYSHNETN